MEIENCFPNDVPLKTENPGFVRSMSMFWGVNGVNLVIQELTIGTMGPSMSVPKCCTACGAARS